MPQFLDRTASTNKFIERMKEYYWNAENIKRLNIVNQEYGYETHIPENILRILRYRRSITAKFVRYVPDSILCNDKREVLLEYKVTNTPRYSFGSTQWDKGQVEADAFDNYLRLSKIDIDVAILIYCPYHSYPILCGTPNEDWIIGDRQTSFNSNGSGTPFYNIDLNKVGRFDDFMNTNFEIPALVSNELISVLLKETINDDVLQTHHDKNSYYNKEQYRTGFNWKV